MSTHLVKFHYTNLGLWHRDTSTATHEGRQRHPGATTYPGSTVAALLKRPVLTASLSAQGRHSSTLEEWPGAILASINRRHHRAFGPHTLSRVSIKYRRAVLCPAHLLVGVWSFRSIISVSSLSRPKTSHNCIFIITQLIICLRSVFLHHSGSVTWAHINF